MARDDFSPKVRQKVAERAGYLCSNPACTRITIGPSETNIQASAKVGRAAHICGASSLGPRYEMSQTKSERESIANAVWLCPSCADLIDKNGGCDYTADVLRRWKRDHETLIKTCLEGNKRVVFQILDSKPADVTLARKLIKFLEGRGALFMPPNQEIPSHVISSIEEIRRFLTSLLAEIDPGSPLEIIADSINHACRHFMNTTPPDAGNNEVMFALGALRKMVGINLGDLERAYVLKVGPPLAQAIPK